MRREGTAAAETEGVVSTSRKSQPNGNIFLPPKPLRHAGLRARRAVPAARFDASGMLGSEQRFSVTATGFHFLIRHGARVLGAIWTCSILAQDFPARDHRIFDTLPRAGSARMEDARRRADAEDLRRLHEKMMDFVRAWNEFTSEYTERGTFNARKARLVAEAWRKLEREQSWPLAK
jgi:hypothetical protein